MSEPVEISPELAAQVRQDRSARPWLFDGTPECEAYPASAKAERMAVIGMPIAVKIGVAIGQARRRDQLHLAASHSAAALAQGLIDQDAAAAIDAAVADKTETLKWHREWWGRIAPPRVLNRVGAQERRPRIEHRAKLAAAGPMPPYLAKKFTVGELAVMKIVADEVALRGTCRRSKKELGDRSRASETTVHNAFRKATRLGLIDVRLRPVRGRKSLPNLVIIIDPEWQLWIARPKYRAIREDDQATQGANRSTPQSEQIYTYEKNADGIWEEDQPDAFRDVRRIPDPVRLNAPQRSPPAYQARFP